MLASEASRRRVEQNSQRKLIRRNQRAVHDKLRDLRYQLAVLSMPGKNKNKNNKEEIDKINKEIERLDKVADENHFAMKDLDLKSPKGLKGGKKTLCKGNSQNKKKTAKK